mmetsp:Transcript_88571/g.247746  ORF Transcript_88571/g.247746 Transcript_88571/m.247746 type:complete len:209 (-) Transcript_88571:49-675(-)
MSLEDGASNSPEDEREPRDRRRSLRGRASTIHAKPLELRLVVGALEREAADVRRLAEVEARRLRALVVVVLQQGRLRLRSVVLPLGVVETTQLGGLVVIGMEVVEHALPRRPSFVLAAIRALYGLALADAEAHLPFGVDLAGLRAFLRVDVDAGELGVLGRACCSTQQCNHFDDADQSNSEEHVRPSSCGRPPGQSGRGLRAPKGGGG